MASQACQSAVSRVIVPACRHYCGHHGDDVINGEVPQGPCPSEGLLNAVGYRGAQDSPMSDELGAYVIIPDGASPEVQEDQLPFPLLGESRGEYGVPAGFSLSPGIARERASRTLPV